MLIDVGVRIEIEEVLKNKGWKLHGINKNVLTDPRGGADYILKTDHQAAPIMVIVAKRKDKDLNEALEQARRYAEELQAPIACASDGCTTKTMHLTSSNPLMLNGEEVDYLLSETLALAYLYTHEHYTTPKKIIESRQQLHRVFDSANQVLRQAGLGAGSERFHEFCNILFLKILSETIDRAEDTGNKLHTSIPPAYRWDYFKRKDGHQLLSYVNNVVIKHLQSAYGKDIFLPLQVEDPTVLKRIMDELDSLSFVDAQRDVKGDAFEYFLQSHVASQTKDLGEYFTPRHIVKTLVKLINPKLGETVYDPFCGTGGMLSESFKHIYHQMAPTERNLKILQQDTIFGGEISRNARIAKMNMILAGSSPDNITRQDSLKNPSGRKHDVVITNMPFSLGKLEQYADLYKLKNPDGDNLCIAHCFDAVNEKSLNPRMGLIIPEGILFGRKFKELRAYIYQNSYVEDIISLPAGAFLPYTGVKTSILYLTQVNQRKALQKSIWHFSVKNDGYTLNAKRERREGENDLDKFLSLKGTEDESKLLESGFSRLDMEAVKNNDYLSLPSLYKKFEFNSAFEIIELGQLLEEITLRNTINAPVLSVTSREGGSLLVQEQQVASEDTKNYKLVPPGCFAYNPARIGVGSIALNRDSQVGSVSPMYVVFKVKDAQKLSSSYLYSLFQSEQLLKQIKSYSLNSVRHNLSLRSFYKMTIPVPPLEEQERIARELDRFTGVITQAKNVIESYHPYFIVDPTWGTKSIAEVCTINPSKEKNGLAQEQVSTASKGDAHWAEDDLLIANMSPAFERGKMSMLRSLKKEMGFSANHVIVIRAHQDKVKIEWIYYCLKRLDFFLKGTPMMTGSGGRKRISTDFVKSYKIPVPPLHIQQQIIEKLEVEDKMIDSQRDIVSLFESKIKDKLTSLWQKSELEQEEAASIP